MMSTEIPVALVSEAAETRTDAEPAASEWLATALTVSFTVAAVLFVSFLAVVTGLV